MYKLLPFLLLVFLVTISCKDDDQELDRIINYDARNNDAPFLPDGLFEAAVQFTSSQVEPYIGSELFAVEYYIYSIPVRCEIIIYDRNGSQPGTVLYRQDVTNDLRSNSWNIHSLTIPVDIIGDGFWVSVAFDHTREQQTIGCDAGPANRNGDWLYDNLDDDWITYRDRVGESINWNIRAVVSEL